MENKSNDRKSMGMFASSMLIFGTIGVFRRYIPLSSSFLAFARGILGGLFLLVFMRIKKKGFKDRLSKSLFLWLILIGVLIGVNWILLFEAYNHTTVAVATLCYYMEPTIVMILSPLVFKEKMTGRKAACAAVAIAGMVLVSGVVGGSSPQGGSLRGVFLGLGAAVLYSTVVIMNKIIPGIDAYKKTTIQLLSAGLAMIPYLILTKGFTCTGIGVSGLLLLLFVGIVHTGIAYVMYFASIEGMKAQSIAILSYIDPVSALFFSALFLREPLSVTGIIGAVMIIGSAIVSEM